MNLSGLNFDAIPSFKVPAQFFVIASVFGIISALIIGWSGPDLWLSRWHPSTLALTHSLLLGTITMTICGATFQLLPVLGGINLPKSGLLSTLVAGGLSTGTLLLVTGFSLPNSTLLTLAAVVLIPTTFVFLLTIFSQLIAHNQKSSSLKAMSLSFIAMALVLILASFLLNNYLGVVAINVSKTLTDSHALWGVVGWVSLMIIGVSFQVLPMFHVAPKFPSWCSNYLAKSLVIVLILNLLATVFDQPLAINITVILLKVLLAIYAITTIKVLLARQRKIYDPSVNFWLIGLTCLLILSLLSLTKLLSGTGAGAGIGVAFGALFIFGWIISVLMAMTIKIMPFLAYLNLQQQCGVNFEAFALLPNLHQLLAKQQMSRLLGLHLTSLAMLGLTLYSAAYYLLLALALLLQFSYLLTLLIKVCLGYSTVRSKIAKLI